MTDKVPCQPLQLEELPKEDEERLEKLFCNLDKDGDGRIDIHDLSVALKELAPHINQKYAEKFLTDSKIGAGGFTLSEFIYYIKEHEKNLRLQFSHLDKNKDGKVDLEELISAFADLGVAINESEATNLLKRMDQDGSLTISYDEWRDYLILAPATDIHSLIHFWRHSTIKKTLYKTICCTSRVSYHLIEILFQNKTNKHNKDTPRPVLVRFTNMKLRSETWSAKSRLKGTKFTLTEFLTKTRQDTFVAARKTFGIRNVWSSEGSIVILLPDKSRKKITNMKEFNQLRSLHQ